TPIDWAQKGLLYFKNGDYERAAPHFEATLELGWARLEDRALFYWLAALSYRALQSRPDEIRHLELFVLAVDALDESAMEGLILIGQRGDAVGVDQARLRARGQLFAYRIERAGGYGRNADNPVEV